MFLRSWDKKPYLSRPIQVEENSGGLISFFYEGRNEETKLLSCLNENDEVEMIGPFGNAQIEVAIGV